MSSSQTTSLPLVVKIQVALAVLATIVTISLVLYIPTLVQKKAQLDSQIKDLKIEEAKLQERVTELDKRKTEAERLGSAVASAYYELNPKQAQKTLEATLNSNPEAAALPRIFIHIRAESQHTAARQVAGILRQKGYSVPGIQILVKLGPDETQVRYFHSTDEAQAQEILDLLVSSGVKNVAKKPNLIAGHEDIRPRQYEIWFAPNSLTVLSE